MVDAGILSEDEPVELLHGMLVEKAVKSPAHETVKNRLMRWLVLASPAGSHDVRIEGCIRVPDRTSLPEPDVAVVRSGGDPRRHPTTALLNIEVSVSTLRTDTRVKLPLYAAAGVPEYWVVHVEARRLLVFSDPQAGAYTSERAFGDAEVVRPGHVAAPPLDLAELFAGI